MTYLLFILALVLASPAWAIQAFPGAEGYGTDTVHGRGGQIIKVTNLNDSGAGSLRAALTTSAPRIVVFTVSGTITLSTTISLYKDVGQGVDHSYLYLAGQTSPGGVQIRGPQADDGFTGIAIGNGAHDILIRHIRMRAGGPQAQNAEGSLGIVYCPASACSNIVIDHNSLQWTTDDAFTSGYSTNITYSWNLLAAGLEGAVVGGTDDTSKSTFGVRSSSSVHHNVMIHMFSRNPLVTQTNHADFRNNLWYNWWNDNAAEFGDNPSNTSARLNFVNNYYLEGPQSGASTFMYMQNKAALGGRENGGTLLYMTGNWHSQYCPSGCSGGDDWAGLVPVDNDVGSGNSATFAEFGTATPFSAPTVTTYSPGDLQSLVLPKVGAYKPSRDSTDTGYINTLVTALGESVRANRPSYDWLNYMGGPWPDLATGAPSAPTDTDGDGIPDAWETAHGLNPNNAADGNQTAANGWTNIENYLNELAGDPIGQKLQAPGKLTITGKVTIQ